jgi:hypothetical protein
VKVELLSHDDGSRRLDGEMQSIAISIYRTRQPILFPSQLPQRRHAVRIVGRHVTYYGARPIICRAFLGAAGAP